MVNFQILYPDKVNEDIGSVEICIEQMNGELSEEINIRVQTSQIGTTATGLYLLQTWVGALYVHVHDCLLIPNIYIYMYGVH